MELNDTHYEHEHATVSMKVILLIFALVLTGGLAYLVWAQNTAPDTTDNSAPSVKKITSTTATNNTVACGDKAYAFSMTFDSKWKGYKIKQVTPTDAIVTCYINMPSTSTDTVWTTESTTNFAKYASIFAISVYTPTQWTAAQAVGTEVPTQMGKNDLYVWAYSQAQSLPQDLQDSKISSEIKTVVATFKINP